MAISVHLSGTEGSGKTSCLDSLALALGTSYQVLIPNSENPVIISEGNRRILVGPNWMRTYRCFRRTAKKIHVFPFFLILNYAMRVMIARWFQIKLQPDMILFDGDLLVHPVAYVRYHVPPVRFISPRFMLRSIALIFGVGKNVKIFHLVRPPNDSLDRIQSRPAKEAHIGPARDLEKLNLEFEKVIVAAQGLNYEVIRIETGSRTPEQLGRDIMDKLLKRAG